MISRKRETRSRFVVENYKRTDSDIRSEKAPAGVVEVIIPGRMMRVNVTKNKGIAVDTIENGEKIRTMKRSTRRRRRDVEVEDGNFGLIDKRRNALQFNVWIRVEADVDVGEGNGVVNKETHPTPTTTSARFVDENISGNRRSSGGSGDFSFLKSGDCDVVVVEKFPELVDFVE